jgi:hypothetical protein
MIRNEKGKSTMAGATKLQDDYDQAIEDIASVKSTLEGAYTPEATRADLAAAVGQALAALEEYEGDQVEEDEDVDED